MQISLLTLSLFLCLLTWLPLWRHQHWLVRAAEFGRLQLSCLLLICLVLLQPWDNEQGLLGTVMFLAVGASILWNTWHFRRYLPLFPREIQDAPAQDAQRQLSLLLSNVQMENRDSHKLLDLVRKHQPDLLVTLETDQWWQEHLDGIKREMPSSVNCPLDNRYGMHVYSRLDLEDVSTEYIVESGVPSLHMLVVLPSGEKARLHVLHPAPPSPTENEESRERDAELLVVARKLEKIPCPTLVIGDFNDVPWSRTATLFRRISGLLDPRVGRGLFNTFHARIFFLRWPLDHVYLSTHFRLLNLIRLPAIGSDHFPLLVAVQLDDTAGQSPAGTPTRSEREQAKVMSDAGEASVDDVPDPGN